jgi:hypothetical protein
VGAILSPCCCRERKPTEIYDSKKRHESPKFDQEYLIGSLPILRIERGLGGWSGGRYELN